eukprot:COSAG02_NODE_63249_length_263_cov_1.426829_1_plen_21_part_01
MYYYIYRYNVPAGWVGFVWNM